MTTFVDTEKEDQYENNGFISQSQSKEEREAGQANTPILGNCKVFYTDGQPQQASKTPPSNSSENLEELEDDIPF